MMGHHQQEFSLYILIYRYIVLVHATQVVDDWSLPTVIYTV